MDPKQRYKGTPLKQVKILYLLEFCCFGSQYFYHGVLKKNYRKITIKGHFPIILLKIVPLYSNSLIAQSIRMDPKQRYKGTAL